MLIGVLFRVYTITEIEYGRKITMILSLDDENNSRYDSHIESRIEHTVSSSF